MKIGMYGSRRRAGQPEPEVAQELVDELEGVLAATRDQLARRGSAGSTPTMTSAMTIHIVRSVELMLGWNVTRWSRPGAVRVEVDDGCAAPGTPACSR